MLLLKGINMSAAKALRKDDIQILSDIEHVLKRPSMYCGNINEETYNTYVYENDKIIQKDTPQIPALLKLFDEIISNSLDEAIRTSFKYATKIKVTFNEKTGSVTVEDNGRGLPIEFNEEFKKWTPEIIFTHLKAGSNFDDDNKEMLVGQYGVGGSLVPIFSRKFSIDTCNGVKRYKQTFENHLQIKNKPVIVDSKNHYTNITYEPNYDYFKVSDEVRENLALLYKKRVKDLSFAYPEITFWFCNEKIAAPKLKAFVEQIYNVYESNEVKNGRIALFYSDTEFQQMSFVNGAYTVRGGTHVEYATSKIIDYIRAYLKKKHKLEVKPIDIRSKLFLLISIRMKNPQFESQTKERLISNNGFKELIDELIDEKFLKLILKNDEIILPIVESYKLKIQVKENIDLKNLAKQTKKTRINKYYPATRFKKYLVLTEGDSACNGLMSVLGRDTYSYFPLKGKPLNVLEAKIDKIKNNEEIKNIVQILNLRLDVDNQTKLNYEYILIAADQDLDGMSIRGGLVGFFYKFGTSLLEAGRVAFLRTPIVVGFDKAGNIKDFYFSLEDYNKNKKSAHKYSYMKGLSSWESTDLSKLISTYGIDHFIQKFEYDDSDESFILNWLKSENVQYRKEHMRGIEFNISST